MSFICRSGNILILAKAGWSYTRQQLLRGGEVQNFSEQEMRFRRHRRPDYEPHPEQSATHPDSSPGRPSMPDTNLLCLSKYVVLDLLCHDIFWQGLQFG